MSDVENLEKLRGHLVRARRQTVAKVLGSKSPSLVAARRLKATQDIIDALDRAILDEKRLHPPPVQQPEIGTAWACAPAYIDAIFNLALLLQRNNKHAGPRSSGATTSPLMLNLNGQHARAGP
jgi:hypothetical protein